jgi:pimeloyl-ACP methyl ester carboxylesterase
VAATRKTGGFYEHSPHRVKPRAAGASAGRERLGAMLDKWPPPGLEWGRSRALPHAFMPAPHQTGSCSSCGLRIAYRRFGAGGALPILVVHGLSFFSYDWIDTAHELAAGREVVAMDMRGFGDSERSPAADYSVPSMAQDIVALLDHLGWKRAVLMGHSMGGRNASFAAARNPARVVGLVLVDYSPENAPAGAQRVAKMIAGAPDVFDSVDAAMRYFGADPATPAGQAKRARYEAYLRAIDGGYEIRRDPHFTRQFRRLLETGERPKLGVDMWQVLGEIACPILALRGRQSDMFASDTMPKLRAANPRIRLVELDGGHNIAGDNPAGLVAAVGSFVDSLERSNEHPA